MKQLIPILLTILLIISSCTSQKKLAYLNNLPVTNGEEYFPMDIPDYGIQSRDILYITVRAMSTDGIITDYLSGGRSSGAANSMQFESNQFISGYDVDSKGNINLPVLGEIQVRGLTLEQLRDTLQFKFQPNFPNSTIECKLLSYKFTVIGEIRAPGTYINYNNYLTVFEAIGRAGGISDYGRRDRILVIRPVVNGTRTFRLDLHDKKILSSEAYFLLPNDVVIIEPEDKKIFNLNVPTFTFILTSVTSVITTTLLLINYLGK
jgi:polysaccharide biosynthesis/export protein